MTPISKNLYLFLGFHSFLLGLFPFFLPVYLYKQGTDLSWIAWFIAFTGLGFILALWILDYSRSKSFFVPVVVSFVLEGCLLGLLQSGAPLPLIALVNGGYSCFYWTLQRILFLAGGGSEDSGRRFGNFQIYVLFILKAGIFIGSIFLENIGVWAISTLTVMVGIAGLALLWRFGREVEFPGDLQQQKPLCFQDLVRFSDKYNSRFVFIIDGFFLYLESYFWLISLFIVVRESFVRLGGLIIVLAIFLGALFYCIKNRIDRIRTQSIYLCSVFLYIASWGLRGVFSEEMSYTLQFVLLLVVAFCTSFFRLAFNKRFFDNAQKSSRYHYLFIKSYYSQLFLVICFGLLGWFMSSTVEIFTVLHSYYWIGGCIASGYLLYLPAKKSTDRSQYKGTL